MSDNMLPETFKSSDVKEILEKKFPNNIFKVRKKINVVVIYTDLVVNIPSEFQKANWRVLVMHSRTDEDIYKSNLYEKMMKQNEKTSDEITNIIKKHYIKESFRIFYINIRPIEDYKWVSKRK